MIKDERYNKPAEKLAKLMSESMLNGYGEPIGDLLTRVGSNKELGYFNSAEEVGNLLSKLVGDSSKRVSFYEPGSGTGTITMKRMEDIVKTNSGETNPLVGHTFDLEEVSAIVISNAVTSEIWYDAHAFNDVETLKIIQDTKQSMEVVSSTLHDLIVSNEY